MNNREKHEPIRKTIFSGETRKFVTALAAAGIALSALLLLPLVQNAIIAFVEHSIKHRKLNIDWHSYMRLMGFAGIAVSIAFAAVCFTSQIWSRWFQAENKGFSRVTGEQPFLLVSFVFVLYILKNIFLVVRIVHMDTLILVLAVLVHAALMRLFFRDKTITYLASSLGLCYGIIAASLFISSVMYDFSWDGRWYHQMKVIALRDGWNPFYGDVLPGERADWSIFPTQSQINHFPHFAELYGAIFSAVFGTIECGKSYNFMFFIASFLYALKTAGTYQKNGVAVLLIGLALAANPVAVAQMFTYYVDGLMGMLIILEILALMEFDRERRFRSLFMVFMVSVMAINTKFPGFICGVPIIAYIIKMLVTKERAAALKLVISGAAVLAVAVCFTGFTPYIRNMVFHGNPFWPLYGDNTIDIMSNQYDNEEMAFLREKSPFGKFASLFLLDQRDWKNIPFNPLKLLRITTNFNFAQPVGGFGMFFIEICMFILIAMALTIRSSGGKAYRRFWLPSALLVLMALVFPEENWWARFVPWLWYGPALLLVPACFEKRRVLAVLLTVFIGVNNGAFFAWNGLCGIIYTRSIHRFISDLRQSDSNEIVVVMRAGDEAYESSTEEKLRRFQVNKKVNFNISEEQGGWFRYGGTSIKYWYEK